MDTGEREVTESGGRGQKGEVLLAAAKRCFLMHGYRRTSMDDVAREAGVAKGTVYLYFKSKEEIFRAVSGAVIRKYLADAEKAAASTGTVEERLAAALEAKVLTIHLLKSTSPHGQELVDSSHTVSGDLFEASYFAFVKVLERILAEAPLVMPVEEAAWMVFRAAHSAGFTPTPPAPDAAEVQRRIRALARVLVWGLTAGQAAEGAVSSRPRAGGRARPPAAARRS